MEENFNLISWDEVNDGELDVENFELKLKNIYNVEYSNSMINEGYILGKHSYEEDKVNGIFSGNVILTIFKENNQKQKINLTDGDIICFLKGTQYSLEFLTDCDLYFSLI